MRVKRDWAETEEMNFSNRVPAMRDTARAFWYALLCFALRARGEEDGDREGGEAGEAGEGWREGEDLEAAGSGSCGEVGAWWDLGEREACRVRGEWVRGEWVRE